MVLAQSVGRPPNSLCSLQNTVQIGNQLPGLKMRSVVIGGLSEDKVSVRRGFRGCMQVGPTNLWALSLMPSLVPAPLVPCFPWGPSSC